MDVDNLLARCYTLSEASPDKSSWVGALIVDDCGQVVGEGYNHFYAGVPPTDKRPAKYSRIVHAEAAACYDLARNTMVDSFSELTMVCTWGPCNRCALSMLGVGIDIFYYHKERHEAFESSRKKTPASQDWEKELKDSFKWLTKAGTKVIVFEGPVESYEDRGILINGQFWNPRTLEFV